MFDPFWLVLAAKMIASAAVVVCACLLVERAGPLVGGMIATLPISAGPGFVFLAMEHDPAFIAASALGGVRALTATTVFATLYVTLAPRFGLAAGLGGALAGWAGVIAVTAPLGDALPASFAILASFGIYCVVFAVCFLTTRTARALRPVLRGVRSPWDMPVRAAAAMGLVAVVLALGRWFGPAAAGIAALAPVVMTSLGLLLYPRIGAQGAAAVLANTLPGMFGNAIAVVVLNVTAVALGSTSALLLAFAICAVWNAGLLAAGLYAARMKPPPSTRSLS